MNTRKRGRKVSIIIPTYNRAAYIKDSVRSAVQQTYGNKEIIVIDDGSTDNTREVLRPYIDEGSIIYLYQKNSGSPSRARNTALKRASGDYICFLDSDDIRMEESIAREAEILERDETVGMICSDWFFFNTDFTLREDREPSWIKKRDYMNALPKELIRERGTDFFIFNKDFIYEIFNTNFVFTSSVIIRRSLLDRVGCFDESLTIGEDCDLWLRIGEIKNIAFIATPLVYRRMHPGSITSFLARNIIDDTRVLEKFMSRKRTFLPLMKKRFYRKLEDFYFDTGYFFFARNNMPESRKRFRRAIRYNPLSYQYYRYFILSLLPLEFVLLARKVKSRIRQMEPR